MSDDAYYDYSMTGVLPEDKAEIPQLEIELCAHHDRYAPACTCNESLVLYRKACGVCGNLCTTCKGVIWENGTVVGQIKKNIEGLRRYLALKRK